ncbi:uncharacterized protein LOC134855378 isoform X2 [Symsagittifera roscoffensis]|uniref:uncharacterized protein LOC134855378 isoform X2 n=1 Tax=Symsagittifera roscoffensis TaxID=84072 RepID=UPI00307C00DB
MTMQEGDSLHYSSLSNESNSNSHDHENAPPAQVHMETAPELPNEKMGHMTESAPPQLPKEPLVIHTPNHSGVQRISIVFESPSPEEAEKTTKQITELQSSNIEHLNRQTKELQTSVEKIGNKVRILENSKCFHDFSQDEEFSRRSEVDTDEEVKRKISSTNGDWKWLEKSECRQADESTNTSLVVETDDKSLSSDLTQVQDALKKAESRIVDLETENKNMKTAMQNILEKFNEFKAHIQELSQSKGSDPAATCEQTQTKKQPRKDLSLNLTQEPKKMNKEMKSPMSNFI